MNKNIPQKLNAAIGGDFGPSCRIEWNGDNLIYLSNGTSHTGEPGTTKTLIPVNNSDWEKFRSSLDKINVWNWGERYEDPQILDGVAYLL